MNDSTVLDPKEAQIARFRADRHAKALLKVAKSDLSSKFAEVIGTDDAELISACAAKLLDALIESGRWITRS